MLLTLRLFGHDIIELAATRDDTDDSLAPPFGFAGSGTGLIETSRDTMLDTSDHTATPPHPRRRRT